MEKFNRIVLELFIRLYESFPHPVNIDSQTAEAIGFGLISDRVANMETPSVGTMADDIMEWLKEEGFIRYDPDANYRLGTFWKVRLTLKGLTVLAYVPAFLKPTDTKEPLIHRARQVIAIDGSRDRRETISKVVGEIFKLALTKEVL